MFLYVKIGVRELKINLKKKIVQTTSIPMN